MFGCVVVAVLLFAVADGEVRTQGDLVTVIAVFRHGDRTPIDPYPTDPYRNLSYWPVNYGQLTNIGKNQHYELGKWLRNRYSDFLPASYSEQDVYVRSTDVDRTLMSAYSNLAGLYEPSGAQVWNSQIEWQPIPVHTKPETEDYVLAMKKPCGRYNFLMQQLQKSEEFQEIAKRNHDLYAYLSLNTGRVVNSIETLEFIYNTLFIEDLNNFTLPEWTGGVFPEKMRPLAQLSFAMACYTPEMARLKAGPLINEFIHNLYNITVISKNHSQHRKLWMYSAHDTTIANVLNALNLFERHSPPYASTILFELRYSAESYFVNIFYKNTSEARLLKLPGCDLDCPLEDFVQILEPITVNGEQWHRECEVSVLAMLPFTTLQDAVIVACSVVFLILMISIVVGILCTRPKSEKRSYLRLPDSDETV